ncbi:MAG: HIT domain-containing protein, partial [Candidatus Obscuribacterales bacterium]|nr:HIT domain-containing protein [Candidatus Obscuribacterales bacterium]
MSPNRTSSDQEQSCLFCSIANKKIPADIVYEDECSLAFRDINPQAPTHVLVIPKQHFANVKEVDDKILLGSLLVSAGN